MFKLLTLCEARHLEAGVHAICRWVQVPDRPDNTTGYDDPVAAAQTIESPKHKLPIRRMAKVIVSWLLVVCEQVVNVTYSHQQHITSQHNIVQFVMCCLQDALACSQDLTRFNKIATQGAPQMAVDKEANSLSRVYSYYSKFILCLFYM